MRTKTTTGRLSIISACLTMNAAAAAVCFHLKRRRVFFTNRDVMGAYLGAVAGRGKKTLRRHERQLRKKGTTNNEKHGASHGSERSASSLICDCVYNGSTEARTKAAKNGPCKRLPCYSAPCMFMDNARSQQKATATSVSNHQKGISMLITKRLIRIMPIGREKVNGRRAIRVPFFPRQRFYE